VSNTTSFSADYVYELPENHRFPIQKYELVYQQLLHRGHLKEENFTNPGLAEKEVVLLTHSLEYIDALLNQDLERSQIRKIGLPVHPTAVKRAFNTTGGTVHASKIALESGLGINIAGGTHHAYEGHGEGFCVLNDIAVAINFLLDTKKVKKALIADLDVHQGNGSARIFGSNSAVFTFSIHGQNNYPLKKERSDLDIPLKDGTSDSEYLTILQKELSRALDHFKPGIIYYQAGVDILETDQLGRLNISRAGCIERDKIVSELAHERGIPLVITMGGGYSPRISDIVNAHYNTIVTALNIYGFL
jgi:acetoin utilization deacetylase AcuC-like enzyme